MHGKPEGKPFVPGQVGWGRHKASLLSLGALLAQDAHASDGAASVTARAHETSLPPLVCGEAEASVIAAVRLGIETGAHASCDVVLENRDRAFGARLSGLVAERHGSKGLPDDTITVRAIGTAGQSFGAFASRGMTLSVTGDANDYVGKGLSGGILVVKPSPETINLPEASVIVGNTVLYGATSGRVFFRGRAGERFAVRNSGATAVVEGVGDHGCEYMTGGTVLILGPIGRNFAAGMSGGVAYVLETDGAPLPVCGPELVMQMLSDEDETLVRALLHEHMTRTMSPLAAALLADTSLRERFRAITSVEFQSLKARMVAASASPARTGEERSHG